MLTLSRAIIFLFFLVFRHYDKIKDYQNNYVDRQVTQLSRWHCSRPVYARQLYRKTLIMTLQNEAK